MLREGINTGIYTFASSDRTGPRKKKIRGKVVARPVWVSLFEINLKEIFNTLMTIARVKLLMLLVRVILPKTALVLWILKFNINVRVIPTIHTSLCPIFVYIPKNYRSMIFFLFILTTKYFRQQPDSLRNLIDMFFISIFDPSWNVWAISSGLSECFGLCAREHCLHGRDLSLLNVHVVERIDALSV